MLFKTSGTSFLALFPIAAGRSSLMSWMCCVKALALTFAGEAKHAIVFCREGKLELTESARGFQEDSAPQNRLARSGGEEATGPDTHPSTSSVAALAPSPPF